MAFLCKWHSHLDFGETWFSDRVIDQERLPVFILYERYNLFRSCQLALITPRANLLTTIAADEIKSFL